ncbi:MAG: ABC transporter permease, partial [Parvibaculum sp.]
MNGEDSSFSRAMRVVVPVVVGLVFLGIWEVFVRIGDVPPFVLPAPSRIWESFILNFGSLMASLWVTLRVTLAAFLLAAVGGIGLAILFSQSRRIEMAL